METLISEALVSIGNVKWICHKESVDLFGAFLPIFKKTTSSQFVNTAH